MQNQSLSTPPHNKEAEQIVLGSIIANGIIPEIEVEDFYFEAHQKIFNTLLVLKYIDIVSLSERLGSDLENVGGRTYLAKLNGNVFSHKVKPSLEIIRENSEKRKIRDKILKAENQIQAGNYDIGELVEDVYHEIKESRTRTDEKDDVVLLEELAEKQKGDYSEKYATELHIFDKALDGGFKSGDLIIISAPTGFGKTTLTQNMTFNFANQGLPCLWFSYEMLGIHLHNKFKQMGATEGYANYIPLKHTSGSIDWIEKKIIESKKKHYTKIVAIDHLGFLLPRRGGPNQNQNYSAYLGQMCRDLKMIALEQDVIIILPVHMRKTDDPKINDIRDSSGIAQEADAVFTIKREVNPDQQANSEYTNYSQITLAKNRATGRSVKGWFELQNDLFCHNAYYEPLQQNTVKRF